MTDTTDKLSLQQLKDVRELCLPHTAWRSIIDELISARDQLEAERQRADDTRASFDELAGIVGFSKERCDQTGDSPMDCARELLQRTDKVERANRNQYRDLVAGQDAQKQLEEEIAALKAKLANPVVLEYRKHDGFTDPEKVRLINAVTDRCAAAIKESGFTVKE